MCSMTIAGCALSVGHHLYYTSMNGKEAGSSSDQAWSLRFGTAFSFLVVACFKAATVSSLTQYVWRIVKEKCFTVGLWFI
jgi:hypothetical protein